MNFKTSQNLNEKQVESGLRYIVKEGIASRGRMTRNIVNGAKKSFAPALCYNGIINGLKYFYL